MKHAPTNSSYQLAMSATRIFQKLLPIQPTGDVSLHDTICYLCGHNILSGEKFHTDKMMSSTFVSWGSIKRRAHAHHVCSACVNVLNVKFMRECASVLMTEHGIFRLNSSADIAALMLSPPKGHFSAWISTKKMQHMCWRAEVSTSNAVFSILFDDESLMVRRDLVLKGYAAWRIGEAYLKECGTKAVMGPTSVKLEGGAVGSLHPNSRVILEAGFQSRPELKEAVDVLDSLWMGEWLGVYALLNTKMENTRNPSASMIDLADQSTWPIPRPMPEEVMAALAQAAGSTESADE